MTDKPRYRLPDNVNHSKAEIPELCDIFWAVLVVIFQEYFEDPENFKIAIFADTKTPETVYSLLLALNLNIPVTWLPRGDGPLRDERNTNFVKFAQQKAGILVVNDWSVNDELDLPCTQAIELGVSINGLGETSKRMHMLQKACESAGKRGRFITIYTPHDMERRQIQPALVTAIQTAESYRIDLLENTKLFRQRFNHTVNDAFAEVDIKTRVTHYTSALKRRRYELNDSNEESYASLQQLHRCAAVMALPFKTVRSIDMKSLTSRSKLSPPWLAAGGISSMYKDAAVAQAMRVLRITHDREGRNHH
ncbi:hypothetical protein Vi05172_g7122 [Venturia inaequalis]|nr:hypothetical protein Vi05172_g7122 [Venturia inaequalis]